MFITDNTEQNLSELQIQTLAGALNGLVLLLNSEAQIESAWAEEDEHPLLPLGSCQGQAIEAYFPPKVSPIFQRKFAAVLEDGTQRSLEFCHTVQGKTYWYEVILKRLQAVNLNHVSVLIRDITRQLADREALKQGQASLQAVVASLDDLVFLLDSSGVFLNYWTRDPERLFLSPEQFLNQPLEAVFEAETARMFRNAITWVLHSRKPQTVDYPSVDGQRWSEATINAVEPLDMPIRISILVKDITRRKQAEIALRRFQEGLTMLNQISFDQQMEVREQVEEGLNLMLDYFRLSVGVVSHIQGDQYTLLNLVNRGMTLELAVGETVPLDQTFCREIWQRRQIVAECDLQHTEILQTFEGTVPARAFIGTTVQVENRPYGTVSFFDANPYPRQFDSYDIEFLRIFTRWISFVLEQELQKNRLIAINQNKERIMDIIAHDLRNPMGAVKGLAEYALHMGEDQVQGPIGEVLNGIIHGTDRALQLLESLLKVERMDTGRQVMNRVPCAPVDLLREVLEQHRELLAEQGIEVDFKPETREYILLDPLWMTQALNNLLSNAQKFTPQGGRITLKVSSSDQSVRVSIADTGIGIPPEMLPHIFDKFTQAKRLGLRGEATTGLGLYLVHQIVELHQGRIWCESQPQQGACFVLEFPKLQHQDPE